MRIEIRRTLIFIWLIFGIYIIYDLYNRSGIVGFFLGSLITVSLAVIFWQIPDIGRHKIKNLIDWPLIFLFLVPVIYILTPDVYKEISLIFYGGFLIILSILIYFYGSLKGEKRLQTFSKK